MLRGRRICQNWKKTDWGKSIVRKIDAYYDWHKTLDLTSKKIDVDQSLLEIVDSSASYVGTFPLSRQDGNGRSI